MPRVFDKLLIEMEISVEEQMKAHLWQVRHTFRSYHLAFIDRSHSIMAVIAWYIFIFVLHDKFVLDSLLLLL